MIVQRRKINALRLNNIFFYALRACNNFFSFTLKISNSLFIIVTLNRAKKILSVPVFNVWLSFATPNKKWATDQTVTPCFKWWTVSGSNRGPTD